MIALVGINEAGKTHIISILNVFFHAPEINIRVDLHNPRCKSGSEIWFKHSFPHTPLHYPLTIETPFSVVED